MTDDVLVVFYFGLVLVEDLLNGLCGDILGHKECWTNDDRRGRTVIGVGDFRLNCVMILSIAGTMAPSYLIRLVSSLGDILHFVQRVVFHEKGILSCLGRQGNSNGSRIYIGSR